MTKRALVNLLGYPTLEKLFIEEFDESTYKIINFLKHLSKNINFPGYAEYAKARLLELASLIIDDKQKEEAVEQAFSKSSVFAVYGPAGTGKPPLQNILWIFLERPQMFFVWQIQIPL